MKLRNKVLAGLTATVLALSMMMGTAMASTDALPYAYSEDAGSAANNDVWVVLYGGSAATPLTDDAALRDSVTAVDVVFTGNCDFDAQIINNSEAGWGPQDFVGQTVDGETAIEMALPSKDMGYVEVVVNVINKTEGALAVARLDFKDADGNVVLSHGAASEAAPAEVVEDAAPAAEATAVPKTGVASLGLIFGLGAAVLGSGAVVLKKKEK